MLNVVDVPSTRVDLLHKFLLQEAQTGW